MTAPENALLTLGEIARRLNVPLHRVEYAVRSRRIQPEARAGNLRVFSEAAVQTIAAFLRQIDSVAKIRQEVRRG